MTTNYIYKELNKECTSENWLEGKVVDLLQRLDGSLDCVLLMKLKAGVLLNKIRKKAAPSSPMFQLSSNLIEKLKVHVKDCQKAKTAGPPLRRSSSAGKVKRSSSKTDRVSSSESVASNPLRVSSRPLTRSISKEMEDTPGPTTADGLTKSLTANLLQAPPEFPLTNLKFRNDWRNFLVTHSLADPCLQPHLDVGLLAASIEEVVFQKNLSSMDESKNVQAYEQVKEKYVKVMRAKAANLKSNQSLRFALLRGELSVDSFVDMTHAQMLSKGVAEKVRKELQVLGDKKMMPSAANGTASVDYTCDKCFGKKTTYVALQLRSADEPYTTFVTCSSCGHRWIIED